MVFDTDSWQEIWSIIRRNKLRTFLTALGVFWGVFMLIIMVGAGRGLENGVQGNMRGFATNSVFLWGRRTTVPYQGLPPGRRIQFTNEDIQTIRQTPGIEYLAPRNQLGNWRGGNTVSHDDKSHAFRVTGDYPEIRWVESVDILSGRHINELDIKERRKVAVIGQRVEELLYEKGEDSLQSSIEINGIYFEVIGVFKTKASGEQAEERESTVYTPFTTFQQAFNTGNTVGWFTMTVLPGFDSIELEKQVKLALSGRHKVAPEDEQAFGSFNAQEEFQKVSNLFLGIRILIWVVGILTLLAGVIGVSNVMLISVKERTREIGVRKALGATPFKIIFQIVQESVVLTSLAGYLGVVIGVLLLQGASILTAADESGTFKDPQIDIKVALVATAVLIVSGALAGIIPARSAARVNPVIALRSD